MVDAIAWLNLRLRRRRGRGDPRRQSGPFVDQPPVLPENLTIALPDLAAVTAPPKQTVNLWD